MNALNDAFISSAPSGVLRFITAGSVDDGKSTLIGRLLYDSKGVFVDQLDAISRTKYKRVEGDRVDFSLLTDGLEAEREQGITIDVAYRYFATPARKFIVADAPGHEQYTRNMVTGASTSDAAVILVDATRAAQGELLPQTVRHSTLLHLLGIRHIIVAINKMDLVGWDRNVFERIRAAYEQLARRLGIQEHHVLPLSALEGDNVVNSSSRMPWYEGRPLLSLLESLASDDDMQARPFRMSVQWVIRHQGEGVDDFRGYAGRIHSGTVRAGDEILLQPSLERVRVKQVLRALDSVDEAIAGDSVTLLLDRDVDLSRGDVLVHAHAPAHVNKSFEAELCWLDSQALSTARKYLLKQGSRLTTARITTVKARRDQSRLFSVHSEEDTLRMNDIGKVSLNTRDVLAWERYAELPALGSFILIDPASHQTAAAGMFL